MLPLSSSLLGSVVLSLLASVQGQLHAASEVSQPYRSFRSHPVSLEYAVEPHEPDDLTEGALFLCPRQGDDETSQGPLIVSNRGQTIWDGTAEPYNFRRGMVFEPGIYAGERVAALWQGDITGRGFGAGYGLILDSSYNVIANVTSTVGGEKFDFHEFQISKSDTALVIIYAREKYDLSPFEMLTKDGSDGWIVNAYVQEIDIATGEALFTWNSVDHLDPFDSYHDPGTTGGSEGQPWDYLHMNSIDKDASGNYLISCKHFNALFYISPDGDIIWQLGGRKSSFSMGDDTVFHQQHDARWVEEGSLISLFDNAVSGYTDEKSQAESMFLRINIDTMEVSLDRAYRPYRQETSPSQGSTRQQPNGDVLSGFGSQPWVVEHNDAGDTLWAAEYSGGATSYRVARALWLGAPSTEPSMYISTSADKKTMSVFLSWNGDTRVTQWHVHVRKSGDSSSDSTVKSFQKAGFETMYSFELDSYQNSDSLYVWADGHDDDDVIGTTQRVLVVRQGQGFSVPEQRGVTGGSPHADQENGSLCTFERLQCATLALAVCATALLGGLVPALA